MKELVFKSYVVIFCCFINLSTVYSRTTETQKHVFENAHGVLTSKDHIEQTSLCLELIIEKDNQAISGAEVTIEGIHEVFRSFESGRVIIDNLEKGKYTFTVNAKGYDSYISTIELKESSVKQNVEMKKH